MWDFHFLFSVLRHLNHCPFRLGPRTNVVGVGCPAVPQARAAAADACGLASSGVRAGAPSVPLPGQMGLWIPAGREGSVRAPRTDFVGPISGAKDIGRRGGGGGGGGVAREASSSDSFLYSQRLHSEAETYFSCGAQPLPFCSSSPPSCQLFHSFPGAAGHRHTLLKPSGERGGGIFRAWFEPSTKGPQTLTSLCLYPGGTPASAA